jgi:hypothetical protein
MNTPQAMTRLSHCVDAMEALAEQQLPAIAKGNPQALSNLRARLIRLQHTIETAALNR